jgi:hypothetical protein
VNWEYKVSNAPTSPHELQAILDRDGHEQWELVSTTLISSRLLLLFKRPFEYEEPVEAAEEETEIATEPSPEFAEETSETFAEAGEESAS